MYSTPLINLATSVSTSDIMGTRGSQSLISALNTQWNNGRVVFGTAADVFSTNFNNFVNTITDKVTATANAVAAVAQQLIACKSTGIFPIYQASQLTHVPEEMRLPILTYPPIRKLLINGTINGWGYSKRSLPEEDVVGRLIDNGSATFTQANRKEWPDHITTTWKSTDPTYTPEELESLADSRHFFEEFITRQLSDSGDRIDPTDLSKAMCTDTFE